MQSSAFKYFFEVAQLGSIRKASQKLNVAASAISRQIMLLEHDVGTPLVERLSKGVRLTDAGEIMFRYLGEASLIQERALGWIEEIKGAQRGRVKVATVEGLMSNFLPRTLKQLNEKYPNIQVEMLVVGADRVTDMLREDECDIGLVFQPRDISQLVIYAEHKTDFAAVMPPEHPLAGRSTLTIEEVAPYPVVLNASSFTTRTLVDRAAARARRPLRIVIETNSIEGMKSFAKSGLGIIFLPAFVVERERRSGELVTIPMSDREFRELKLFVLTKQSRSLSPAGNRLLSTLVDGFQALEAS
jgi:DNA-binding transcriptional LysR family regulator